MPTDRSVQHRGRRSTASRDVPWTPSAQKDVDRVLIELIRLVGDGVAPQRAAATLLGTCTDRDVLQRLQVDVTTLRDSYQHRFAEHALTTLSLALAQLDRAG